jgi:tetratricopeptide (TPR) repeat protein
VKWFAVLGFAAIGTVLIVLGVLLLFRSQLFGGTLETYEGIASVVSMFVGLAGLVIAVVQLRQRPTPQATDEPEQRDRAAETPAEAVERQGEEEARMRTPTGPASVITPSEPAPERGTRARQVWNVPGPVRSFTGRDTQLAELRDQLETGQRAGPIPVVTLYGMGGIGKTQLARAYAHRHRDDYQLGWWILAESPLTTATALGELAVRLGAPAALPQPQQLTYAGEALAERDHWLLVFDNATDPAALEPLLPTAGKGHVLVTSRSSAWHGLADPIPVELLPLAAAAKLLGERTGDPDQPAAEALAEELGRLPLALEQAAAYASRQQLSLADYLAVFRTRRAELLARGQPLAYQGTVDAAYTLALDQLGRADPAAAQLLGLCALLAPDEIPVGRLLDQPELLPSPLADAARDPLRRSEVTGALYQGALLTPDVDNTVRLHRLIQAVTLEHLADHDRHQLVDRAVGLLAALFPEQPHEPAAWPVCAQLLAHGYALVEHARQQQLTTAALGTLLHRMGVYVWARGMGLAHARELHEQALAMRRQVFAGDHPDLARSLTNVAIVLADLGDLTGARELEEQALAMCQRVYAGDHPRIVGSLSNLGVTLEDLGEYARARELHEQAVAMVQRLHMGDHIEVANQLSNLADVLRALGELGRARELHEQALAMLQRLYAASDHPYTSNVLVSLAEDMRGVGDYGGARDLDEQALAMRRRLYAGDNPSIARSLNNLAEDLYGLGDYAGARGLHEQALAMYQRLYTTDHPDIARSLNNLAEDLRGLGEYAGARELHEQALAMFQRVYERDHPRIAITLNNLAEDLRGLGDYAGARDLDEQALAMHRRLYTTDHRDIARSLNNLAEDLRGLGDHARARDLEEQALAMFRRLAGRDIPTA